MLSTIVWTLPRPPKSKYKGGFPLHFEQNLMQLLGYPELVLQPFGGMAEIGMRIDLNPEVAPDLVADAHSLPLPDAVFDCVLLDPPYSDREALDLYQTPPLRPGAYTKEAVRVLKEGGWLCVYTDREPRRPARCNHALRIIVVLRPGHTTRTCMVFQKRKPGMPYYGTEAGEDSLPLAVKPDEGQGGVRAAHSPVKRQE